jgi:GDP-L-fucose synthase
MVGSAITRKLIALGFENLIQRPSKELDLKDQQAVKEFFRKEKPEYVFLATAKVGGIVANNQYRAQFIHENLMVQNNVIHYAYESKVKKLMFLGSSCIYPKFEEQPLVEKSLLTGLLEPNNEPDAIAEIAGIKMCEVYRNQFNCDFISVIHTNLYGRNVNYDLEGSHVLPAMIRKFHEAKEKDKQNVILWGSGSPRREFLFADDLAEACVYLMKSYSSNECLNIGTGKDISTKELAEIVKKIVGYSGSIIWDESKPDGTPSKLLDVNKLNSLGWNYKTELEDGIFQAYKDFKNTLYID